MPSNTDAGVHSCAGRPPARLVDTTHDVYDAPCASTSDATALPRPPLTSTDRASAGRPLAYAIHNDETTPDSESEQFHVAPIPARCEKKGAAAERPTERVGRAQTGGVASTFAGAATRN